MKPEWIVIAVACVALIGIGIKSVKSKNAEYNDKLNKSLDIDIDVFNETKEMSWGDACLVINSKANDLVEREALKDRILALRRLKGVR
jgi:hypothetical protein